MIPADTAPEFSALGKRGLALDGWLHLIASMHDHDLWMAFFKDPAAQILTLMQEARKGYSLQATTP